MTATSDHPMNDPAAASLGDPQAGWIRLDTLARLRWLAVSGQLGAIIVAGSVLELQFNLWLALLVVLGAVISNLTGWLTFPRTRRLAEHEALLLLTFDTVQLSLLLYLTGGLNNPFALLLLAPFTIASTVLKRRSTLTLGALVIALASLLAFVHEPIISPSGAPLLLPPLFLFGFWLALVIGVVFIGLYLRSVAEEKQAMAEALQATQMALTREQKFTELSGVVAAAAHELGTPLATIKLASAELIDTLSDRADALEDAQLIREQVERCHVILRSMGRAGKDDLHMRQAPLAAILQEAAAPHDTRGKTVRLDLSAIAGPDGDAPMPEVWRQAGIIHGLRNLIQNAVDFAAREVVINGRWDPDSIALRISDDGPGFPAHLLARIGEPFLRDRRDPARARVRAGYQGMGLGLFIAKTLLERSGAAVTFSNGPGGGAAVDVVWPRTTIEAPARQPLGDNRPMDQTKVSARTADRARD